LRASSEKSGSAASVSSASGEKKTGGKALLGDLDGDGRLTRADAKKAANFVVGKATPSPKQLQAGDLDRDGKIGLADATAIYRAVRNKTPAFVKR
jgi:hypothetical protein